ncbi:ATP-binding cassette sub-family C member 9-like isoform X2 [Amphiura filiformis]|uniref:ATP-binding cassette sub-family C member 9-like isoform X2 n=1 Tax=Amphiura filiformis TaxID=82378 RepID=UPI003B22312F
MAPSIEKFNWYCGVNSTETETLEDFEWNRNNTIKNACFTNLIYTAPHIIFVILASLVLLVLGCATSLRKKHPRYLLPFPGHYALWVLYFPFMFGLLCALGEGLITDVEVQKDSLTQPHLYIPGIVASLGGIIALVYYHHMEVWNKKGMAWLLLLYWVTSLGAEVARFLNLYYDSEYQVDDVKFWEVMRVDVSILMLVLYSLFTLICLYSIICKSFCAEKPFPNELKNENMRYLQNYSNMMSGVFFWWMNWLFTKGYKEPLELKDLGDLSNVHTTLHQRNKFTRALREERERADKTGKSLSLYKVYLKVYGADLAVAGIVKFIGDSAGFVPPLALSGAILYVSNNYYDRNTELEETKYVLFSTFFANGFILIVVMFLSSFLRALCLQVHYYIVITESAHIKVALQAAVYDKALCLSSWTISGGSMTMGLITNHMSVDALNLMNSMQWVHYVWSIPYVLTGYLLILYLELGVAALIGSVIFIVTVPLQTLIAKRQAMYQKNIMAHSDDRLKQTNEMLQGIKVIKLYGWEDVFFKNINAARAKEILNLIKQLSWRILLVVLTQAAPLLVTLVAYSLYSKFENKPLTPDVTFAALSVFNQMIVPLIVMPTMFTYHVNAVISTRRLTAYFDAPEIEDNDDGRPKRESITGGDVHQHELDSDDTMPVVEFKQPGLHRQHSHHSPQHVSRQASNDKTALLSHEASGSYGSMNQGSRSVVQPIADNIAVKISNGCYTWDVDSARPILTDINVEIETGKLTVIVGQVGAGKSSLLSALLGEMTTLDGMIQWNSDHASIAYGAQKPWLLNATFRDNILFGNEFDEQRYKAIIKACSLQPDIDILPAGDQTEIGEKGINLSGGQKQRVSVARAMYSPNKIVLLDDPLSALDVHVGGHLFEEGIVEFLNKENKRTVILVTHQIQYLDRVDKIVYIKEGKIVHQGTLESIEEADPQLAASWRETMQEIVESESETEDEKTMEERAQLMRMVSQQIEDQKKQQLRAKVLEKQASIKEPDSSEKGNLIEKEERLTGSVKIDVYWYYIKAIGVLLFAFVMVLFVGQNGLSIATNFWLSDWSEAGNNVTNATTEELNDILFKYLTGYAALSISSIVMSTISSVVILLSTLYAARRLHNKMLFNIMHAPMRFFDTTPIGRVLNRFSSDTNVMDMRLGNTMSSFFRFTLTCISAIIVNAIVSPFFIIAIIPIAALYILLMVYFIATSRELQRIDSISKSPIFAQFSESLGGLSTIRAYSQEKRFQRTILKKIETNNVAFLYLQTANRWLGIRLDFIGAVIVLVAGFTTMTSAALGSLEPSYVGLAITYALSIASQLNWVIRMSADMEMQMNAIERIEFYSNVEKEDYDGILVPSREWPDRGDIVYQEVSARYARELDPVLQNISIHMKAGEKVGICGRTGSGKSSLTLTLFRIIETFNGEILIDGINIARLPLSELRHRLSIIPQDPVLFTGTIRFNLDPEGDHPDSELWESLEIAQLKHIVTALPNGLDSFVSEGGENFSVGQRQLFCLARAFLRKSRILIMDEATASIDLETDAILQQVVATAFKDRTVITIAHRVATILDSDKILVLSDGHIAEYDTPDRLLAREDSIFTTLVKGGK